MYIGTLALFRSLPMGFKIVYLPRGPVGNLEDKEAMVFFESNLKNWAKKKGAICVTADPFVINNYIESNQKNYFDKDFFSTITCMNDCGFKYKGRTMSMEDTYQPRINLAVKLFDDEGKKLSYVDIVKKASSKTRPKLKGYQEKRGVFFERYTGKNIDFKRFSRILSYTEERQSINLRNAEYFSRFAEAYKDEIVAYFAVLDLEKYKKFIQKKIEKNDNISINIEKLKEIDRLISNYGKNIDIASGFAHLPEPCEHKINIGEYLYAGSNLAVFPEINAPIGIVGKFLEESAKIGLQYFNLGGVDSDKTSKLYKYKSQFGTDVWEFVGDFALVINTPMYILYNRLLPVAKKIIRSSLIKKLKK